MWRSTTSTGTTLNTGQFDTGQSVFFRVTVNYGWAPPRVPPPRPIAPDVALFAALDCSKGDPPDKIRRAYRRLAKMHHPDLGGDSVRFRRIHEAYAELKRRGLA